MAKVRGGTNRGRREQRHHSKTFTIDSDDDDENDYRRSEDDDSDDDDGRGNNNTNTQKRKGLRLSSSSSSKSTRVARAYQHEKKKKTFYYAQQRHEFSVCRCLLVAIAMAFGAIFLVERFAPKDVYIHRTIQNGRNKAKVKVKEHARRAREAFRAYTSYDFEKANTRKYEENLREEYALAAMVANSPSGEDSSRLSERSGGVICLLYTSPSPRDRG